jgi:hypothetical protein
MPPRRPSGPRSSTRSGWAGSAGTATRGAVAPFLMEIIHIAATGVPFPGTQSLMGAGTRGCAGRHSSASLCCSAKFNIRVDLPETRFELKRPVRYSNRPVNSHRNSKMTPAQVAEAQKLAGHERTGCAGVIVKTKRFACVPGLPFLKNRREQWNCCVSRVAWTESSLSPFSMGSRDPAL